MKATYLALLLLISIHFLSIRVLSIQLFATEAAAKDLAASISPFCERLRLCMLQTVANESDGGDQQWINNSVNNLMDNMCDMMIAAQIKRGRNAAADRQAAICAEKMQKMSCEKLLNIKNPSDMQHPLGCNK